MLRQRQSKRTLGLIACQTGSGIENTIEVLALGQILGPITGQVPSDSVQLLAIGQGMFEYDKELFKLDRDLHHGRQHHDEGALLFAGNELGEHGLNHFRVHKELVKVVQEEQRRAVGLGQRRQSAQSGERIARASFLRSGVWIARKTQAVSDVPDRHFPFFGTCMANDLAFGFVGFERLKPDAAEGGIDVARQIIG